MTQLNKTVVLTGATGVLCSEFARFLARSGCRLALVARSGEKLAALREEIAAAGGVAFCYAADVTNKEQLLAAHRQIVQDLGPCEVLINGAGGNHPAATTGSEAYRPGEGAAPTFFDLTRAGFSQVFDLNLWGTVLPCQIFAPDMAERPGCSIVNISSMAAFSPLTKTPAYCAAKAGVSNFTQWLAVHLAPCGVRVNAIAPGFFLTRQNRELLLGPDGTPAPRTAKILAHTPMGRLGRPEELLGALRFLVDERLSGFVTGCVLPVDGGFSAYSGV